ncbi:nitroreductase/quinone reductase family protein [Tsukamurella paurometabola]|uniref:Deazaflavin-dependent oxidoreductase, nitroreductase family n=1 Tax=Tsukamurella paurometabola TaxID=2061 RepID=A0A3P8MC81_TSUPA|nr:nitroreductase/quinone reductase family protein [Tsukamurella paurometabola]UEA83159.1 nitroreductase/quinone reductase family protein [Tsukamurella paurometabola]VDR40250.1 deazaflavin-dependent oxidoreductase, nitroreductase family [Tsukamurella paurometabola]
MTAPAADRVRPGRTATAFNNTVAWLARRGISVYGSRELAVRGRRTGEWRTVPVNVLTVDGAGHLVAARGVTQWVRNLRVAGAGELRLGRTIEPFTATEVTDPIAKVPVLRAYLRRWAWEVGAFFPGLSADSSDDELVAAAVRYPVFVVVRR